MRKANDVPASSQVGVRFCAWGVPRISGHSGSKGRQ